MHSYFNDTMAAFIDLFKGLYLKFSCISCTPHTLLFSSVSKLLKV